MRKTILPAAVLLLWSASVPAAREAVIEGLQLPVWLERAGARTATAPGMALESGDRLVTGAGARVLIRTSEGSRVKLGERATFHIETVEDNAGRGGAFRGVMNLLKGAFRFTTTALGAGRTRDIDISIGTATIGIRGTDVWGRSTDDSDLIVLLEGKIEVTREGEPPVTMTKPLSVYTAPRGAPANPLGTVAMEAIPPYAAETELTPGEGVLREDGEYRVYLLSSRNSDYSGEARERYRAAGYPAGITQHQVNGVIWHRVGVEGFISLEDARSFAADIEDILDVRDPWIERAL